MPLLRDLSDRQYRLLLAFQATILKHSASTLPPPNDDDVRDAAGTLASTIETASRGIIYEHQTASLPAQRLAADLRAVMGQIEREGAVKGLDRDAVTVLRRIELGAREAGAAFPDDRDRPYLALLGRMMADAADGAARESKASADGGSTGLIIPG